MSKPWLCTTCVKRRRCPKHFIVWLLGIARYVHSTNCYEPEWKPTYRNSSATMEHQNTMLCRGYSGELKPCDDDKIEKAIKYLKNMSWEIGTVSAECLSEKAGQKMRECIDVLESRIDELEQ